MNRTLKELILAAEFAAIISVLSQMTIPFWFGSFDRAKHLLLD